MTHFLDILCLGADRSWPRPERADAVPVSRPAGWPAKNRHTGLYHSAGGRSHASGIERFATDLVTLIGEDERGNLGVGALPRLAGENGLSWREFPITDRTAPASGRQAEFDQLLDELLTDLAAGRRVAIHCQAGLGRTGLLAAGLLVRSGTGPDDAITLVRSARPGSIETSGQDDFIRKIEFRGLE